MSRRGRDSDTPFEKWQQAITDLFREGGLPSSGRRLRRGVKDMPWPKGMPKPPELRAKVSAAQIGKVVSAETRAKMSAAQMGPVSALSPDQLADYIFLTRKRRFTRAEALVAVGRADLVA